MRNFLTQFRTAFIFSIGMLVICGLIYPLVLTGVAQAAFPNQANGNQIEVDGKVVASSIIGQDFSDERLFHCRPSAYNYNTYSEADKKSGNYAGVASGSNNYGNSNPELKKRIATDIEAFLKENPTLKKQDIPSDIVTASGSGLDPHISIEAATVQVDRIIEKTDLSRDVVVAMIKKNTEGKSLGIFGEDKVNVVKLNLEVAKAIGMI